jgi:hypothetical protein
VDTEMEQFHNHRHTMECAFACNILWLPFF